MIGTDGWEVRTVGSLGSVRGGKRLPKGRSLTVSPTPHPYVRVTDMRQGGVDTSDLRFVPEDVARSIRAYRIFKDDIFISVAGTLGIVGRIPAEIDGANLTENADRITSITCDVDYLMYSLLSESIQNEIDSIRTVGAQPKLALGRIKQFEIPIPKARAEQKRVSQVFRDADDLIATLERLIAKKQAIKQGMMQQLLTGRTRLPGYTGEWAECHLGDVLTVRHGRNQRSVESPSGTVPILATGGQIGWADRPLYSEPSVLIGRKGTIDRPQYQDRPFWTVDTLFYTEISTKADPRFLFYLFQTIDWRSMNEASGVPSLSSTRIESVEVRLPGLAEQKAVREVLDDADVETTVLRARLAKARAIKTGMMQQLLTGRTRLPVEAAS